MRLAWLATAGVVALATAEYRRPAVHAAPALTADMLRARLTAFADDSMQGRATGSRGLEAATRYLVDELTAAHVTPGGDGRTYLQAVPIVRRQLELASAKAEDNGAYIPGVDFLPLVGVFGLGMPDSVDVGPRTYIAGGAELGGADAIAPGKVNGQFIVFFPPRRATGQPDYQLWNVRNAIASYRRAGAVFVATLDLMPRSFIEMISAPRLELRERFAMPPATPPVVAITRGIARKAVGSINRSLSYRTRETALAFPAHNIVAVVPGSDPQLKSEYVVLSAHADHLGMASAKERVGVDSVFNGADAGSGAIALLAIAEQFASQPVKPRRSLVFVWTASSAQGLLGTEFFADRPTVPRDSIVASISVDRIGRPGPRTSGGSYLQATGARRLSGEFGSAIDTTNAKEGFHFALDMPRAERDQLPGPTCDGDEWHFARWGIPSVRISTGPHADDDRVTDKIGRVDFEAYARVSRFVWALAKEVADRPTRLRVDAAKPDPHTICAR